MTWKELAEQILNELTEEQQNQDVTIFDGNLREFLPAKFTDVSRPTDENGDVLDEGHFYISTH
jgi:hypothetical protein